MIASIRTGFGPRAVSLNATLVMLLAAATAINGVIAYAYL